MFLCTRSVTEAAHTFRIPRVRFCLRQSVHVPGTLARDCNVLSNGSATCQVALALGAASRRSLGLRLFQFQRHRSCAVLLVAACTHLATFCVRIWITLMVYSDSTPSPHTSAERLRSSLRPGYTGRSAHFKPRAEPPLITLRAIVKPVGIR